MLNQITLYLVFIFGFSEIWAQTPHLYSFRGVVQDAISQEPLIGASISLEGSNAQGALSDENGNFTIDNMTLGRHQLIAEYFGYKKYVAGIEIKSGKELVLTISMTEDITQMDEVTISAQRDKSNPVNAMAYASTRTFSVEESNKFAAAVDDPLRMVQSYAGVVGIEDGNNHISIRGNSPNGLLWRMEGVDIPNPNHYANPSSSGGGVSVLSSQMLSNSDFSTGAFSAEYGNALAGVFDLKLRKGNNKKREYTFKAGLLGIEAALEGPFSKKYEGSYLINYRYSTLSIIDKLGVDLNGVLNYSDLAYTIHLPLRNMGILTLFGLHGVSSQVLDEAIDSLNMNENIDVTKGKFQSNMSVDGIKYFFNPSKNSFLNLTLAYTSSVNGIHLEENIKGDSFAYYNKFATQSDANKLILSANQTQKFSAKCLVRTGVMIERLEYAVGYDKYYENNTIPQNLVYGNDKSSLAQGFTQIQYDFKSKFTLNAGAHVTYFFLNKTSSIEPRISLKTTLNAKSSLAIAYGLHSQINSLPVYFVKSMDESEMLINKNLKLNKAHHLVLSYQYDFNNYTRFRSEAYYQALYNLAVGKDSNKNYALMNQQFGFPQIPLSSDGKGRNVGIEASVERFMHDGLYFIVTASLSDSKYRTKTSEWLNARYNTRYAIVNTFGKEWQVGKNKQNTISINLKTTFVGGQRYTPIDLEASKIARQEVLNEGAAFSLKTSDFFKVDLGFKFKRNHKKYTSTLALDIMNASNQKNVGGIEFDIVKGTINTWYQAPLIPILSYKLEF